MVNVVHTDPGAELTYAEDIATDRHVLTVSTTPGDAVVLDAGGKIPAVNGSLITNINADNVVAGTTNKVLTAAEKTKLTGIEAAADVTDQTNVLAALVAAAYLLDEDDMASDSATKPPSQQSLKAYVAAMGGGIGAPVFVAANNATAKEKSWAIVTGGTVCTGTNDEAKWALAQTAAGAGGLVNLSSGSFNIQTNLTLTATFRGVGGAVKDGDAGTRVYISATKTITVGHHGNIQDLYYEAAATHATTAVLVQGEVGFQDRPDVLRGVFGYHAGYGGASWPASSILLKILCDGSAGNGHRYIQECDFGPFTLRGGEHCLQVVTSGDGTGNGWFNNNRVTCSLHQGKYYFKGIGDPATGYGTVQVNEFHVLTESANSDTVDGFTLYGVGTNHWFVNNSDWSTASGKFIKCQYYSSWNKFIGNGNYGVMGDLMTDTHMIGYGTNIFEPNDVSPQSDHMQADHSSSPPYAAGYCGDTGIVFGMVVYQDGTGRGTWKRAQANAIGTVGDVRLAICVGSQEEDGTFDSGDGIWLVEDGAVIRHDAFAWSATGVQLYVSENTAGLIDEHKPHTAGSFARRIGYTVKDGSEYMMKVKIADWYETI
jgi:hypothetical protein